MRGEKRMDEYIYFCSLLNKPCSEIENCKYSKSCYTCGYRQIINKHYDCDNEDYAFDTGILISKKKLSESFSGILEEEYEEIKKSGKLIKELIRESWRY